MRYILLTFLIIYTFRAYGQQDDWQEALHQWMTAEDMEQSYGEEMMEQLAEMAQEKLNLNQATREQLEQLPFLTAQQVEEITEYLDRYRPMRTLNELLMITSLDTQRRLLLQHFVYVGEEQPRRVWPAYNDLMKYGKHRLTATVKIPMYERKGDHNGYYGYKYRHDIRYQFSYQSRIKFGLTGAQDSGEPFLANRNKMGYDHYAYYLQLRDMGRLEALNLGTFRVQLGMGLIMNTGFQLGKLASLQSLGRSAHILTAHTSRMQNGYLNGAGATIKIADQWRLTAFASYRALDATLNADGTMRTILRDGYHRTATELSKKGNSHESTLGASLGFRPAMKNGVAYARVNMVYSHFDRPLIPSKSNIYQRYAASGNNFLNISLDYGYNNSRLSMAGETAVNRLGRLASIHTVSYKLNNGWSLMALHRYYGIQYTALHSRSFSEGGSTQNEHGGFLGVSWQPARSWLLTGYADYAHFGWARYQATAASDAFDMLLSLRHSHKDWTWEGRYRLHIRQRDNADKSMLTNRPEHRLRLRMNWEASAQWSLQTQADAVVTRVKEGGYSQGVMVGQHVAWKGHYCMAHASIGWFHTDDYDSSIYQYEQSVLHDFSFSSYYGHGLRYALMLKGNLGQRIVAEAKVGTTNYFSRPAIGSGLQEVAHSSTTDLLLSLQYKF